MCSAGSVFRRVVGTARASTLGESTGVWSNYDRRAVVGGGRVGGEDAGEGGRGRKVNSMMRRTWSRGRVVVALENGSGGDGEVGHAAAGGRTAIRRGFIRVTTNTYLMFGAICCLSHTFQPGSVALLCAEPGVNPALLSQLGTFSSLVLSAKLQQAYLAKIPTQILLLLFSSLLLPPPAAKHQLT